MAHLHSSFGHEGGRQLFIRRLLVFSPVIFLLAIAQCAFFAQIKLLPAVPNLMVGTVVAIAMLDSQKSAVVCGIGAGFVIDAIGASGLSFSPLFLMLCGAICGIFAKKMLPSFLSWTVNLTVFSIFSAVNTFINVIYRTKDIPALTVLTEILLPEMICTVILCLPIFFIIKLCMIPIDAKRRLRLDKFN